MFLYGYSGNKDKPMASEGSENFNQSLTHDPPKNTQCYPLWSHEKWLNYPNSAHFIDGQGPMVVVKMNPEFKTDQLKDTGT